MKSKNYLPNIQKDLPKDKNLRNSTQTNFLQVSDPTQCDHCDSKNIFKKIPNPQTDPKNSKIFSKNPK